MPDSIYYEAPAYDVASLPVMVPAKLVGRDAVIGRVYTRLRENQPVLIYGAPGVGKSAFAATLAAAYTEQPGGVLWLNVHNSSMDELIVRVGRAYDVKEIHTSENPSGMVGAVASTLTQHKPLVVLDGKLDEQVATAFIERCVRGLPALIVTPDPLTDTWSALKLEPLDTPHGATLFKQTAGLPDTPDPDIDRLVEMLKGSPYALVIAASSIRASKQQPVQYLNALTQIPGYNTAEPVLVALTAAFRGLNSALQGLILMMGATHRGEASAAFLSALAGAPKETIQQVMAMLGQQYLVEIIERYGEPFYRLHPAAHAFAQGWLRGSNRLNDLQIKVRDSAVEYAKKYAHADDAAYDRLSAEMDTFLAVAQAAADHDDRDTVRQFIVALTGVGDFVSGRGYVYELLRLNRLASSGMTAFPAYPAEIAVPDDEDEIDTPEAPAFLRDMFGDDDDDDLTYDEDDDDLDAEEDDHLAASLLPLEDDESDESDEIIPDAVLNLFGDDEDEDDDESGALLADDFDDEDDEDEFADEPEAAPAPVLEGIAGLRAALMQARLQNDTRQQGALLMEMGAAQVEEKQFNEAIATYGEALTIYDELGEEDDVLDILDTLSSLMVQAEHAQAAVLHATRGAQLAQKLGDDDTRMHILITLGDAREQLGEATGTEKAYSQALEIARNTGDTQNEAIILYKLGYAQLDNSDPEAASSTWEQALQLFRDQGKRGYEGRAMGGLGTAYAELERWTEAISFYTSALYIAREVKDQDEEALQLSNLGYASVQTEQLSQAVLRYRQALHLAYETDNRENAVSTLVDLVRLLIRSPRYLSVANLLIDDALRLDPADREVNQLKERITNELLVEEANGVQQAPVNGTAQTYAANAYSLLDG